jgi:hypothetical protein
VIIVGTDIYGLDRDGDGVICGPKKRCPTERRKARGQRQLWCPGATLNLSGRGLRSTLP